MNSNTAHSKLGTCHACGGSVSKKAKTCPHCGQKRPYKQELTKGQMVLLVIGALFMMSVITSASDPSASSSSSGGSLSDPQKQQMWILRSHDGVRSKLKDPESAEFKDSFFAVWKDTPVVCGRVNAKNSFGGKGGYQRFVAAGEDVVYLEEEVADFHNVWSEICSK